MILEMGSGCSRMRCTQGTGTLLYPCRLMDQLPAGFAGSEEVGFLPSLQR